MIGLSIREEHYQIFRGCFPQPPVLADIDGAEGRSPPAWFRLLKDIPFDCQVDKLPENANRLALLDLARKSENEMPTAELCVAILAWGGMHPNNGKRLFSKDPQHWIRLSHSIRTGELARSEAYDEYSKLRAKGELPGMGPAYFTKLIYFLMPGTQGKPKGYIMDQWLGCSMNLLFGEKTVKLDENTWWQTPDEVRVRSRVSDANSANDYENFCCAVEFIANDMGAPWTPDLVERALMSEGGRRAHDWRRYVMEQRWLGKFERLR